LLTISNSATDPDIPTNMLTFSLDAGAPPTAAINATNGLFTWPTTDADANTTNQITVRVTDDGIPAFSDARVFTVTVVSRPMIMSIVASNNIVTMTWSAVPGQNYRMQYQDDLAGASWNALAPDVTATAASALTTDAISPASQRFYRVLVLP
jgi:hypothetical protein